MGCLILSSKTSPRRSNTKRILSKGRCCFMVIFSFHNFAEKKKSFVQGHCHMSELFMCKSDHAFSKTHRFHVSCKIQPLSVPGKTQPLGSNLTLHGSAHDPAHHSDVFSFSFKKHRLCPETIFECAAHTA